MYTIRYGVPCQCSSRTTDVLHCRGWCITQVQFVDDDSPFIDRSHKVIERAKSTILAFGAAGKFGGLVVPVLAKLGGRVRGLIRDAKQSKAASSNCAAEIA